MQTQHVQLTLYLPDDAAQPAVAISQDDGKRAKPLSVREAAHAYARRVRDMPAAEQPVARLVHYGAYSLSNAELLAILLATPHALTDAEHILGQQRKRPPEEWIVVPVPPIVSPALWGPPSAPCSAT